MLRALVYGLTLLHLGPGFAFALLAFGCEEPAALLGSVCAMSALDSFATLTAGSWFVFGVGALAVFLVNKARTEAPGSGSLRLWSLLALLCFGGLVGASWLLLTGSQYGFLAVPASLCAAWLLLANPQACIGNSANRSTEVR